MSFLINSIRRLTVKCEKNVSQQVLSCQHVEPLPASWARLRTETSRNPRQPKSTGTVFRQTLDFHSGTQWRVQERWLVPEQTAVLLLFRGYRWHWRAPQASKCSRSSKRAES